MNLKEIQEMWKVDCTIDDIELDASSLEVPKLHAKYAELLSNKKLEVIRYERRMKELDKDKWLWYGGKMSKADIESKNWDYDPFDGLKVMKGEMDYYYDSDIEIQNSEEKIEYCKILLETLSEIVETLRWRHQTISNIIKWKNFEAGG